MIEFDYQVPEADMKAVDSSMRRMQRAIPGVIKRSTYQLALELQREIRMGLRSGAPGGKRLRPLAQSTIDMKGSNKPLIDHGDMMRSVRTYAMHEGGQAAYFVGIHRMARGAKGQSLANIAEIHEEGRDAYTIPVTPKLRRFWMAMYLKGVFKAPLPQAKTEIRHPGQHARPFLAPSFEVWLTHADDTFQTLVQQQLAPVLKGGK